MKLNLRKFITMIFLLFILTILFLYITVNDNLGIYESYCSLSTQINDSKANFDKKLYFVTTDKKGNKIVKVGFQSEVEYEAYQKKFGDVLDNGSVDNSNSNSNSSSNPNSSSDSNSNSDYSYNITGDGRALVNVLNLPSYNLNSHFKHYADQYGYVYDELVSAGLPKSYAIGIISNITSEGTVGLVQNKYTIVTKDQLESIVENAKKNHTNNVGIGLMQWTYWSYMEPLSDAYKEENAWNPDGTLNLEKALKAETKIIVKKALDNYTSAEVIANNDCKRYSEFWGDYIEISKESCNYKYGFKMGYCDRSAYYGPNCKFRAERAELLLSGMSEEIINEK